LKNRDDFDDKKFIWNCEIRFMERRMKKVYPLLVHVSLYKGEKYLVQIIPVKPSGRLRELGTRTWRKAIALEVEIK